LPVSSRRSHSASCNCLLTHAFSAKGENVDSSPGPGPALAADVPEVGMHDVRSLSASLSASPGDHRVSVCRPIRRTNLSFLQGRAFRRQGFGSSALLEKFNENTCSNNLSTRAFASNLKAKIPPFRLRKVEKGPRTTLLVPGFPGPSGICSIFLSTAPNYRGGFCLNWHGN
jgi:hypothetical protein